MRGRDRRGAEGVAGEEAATGQSAIFEESVSRVQAVRNAFQAARTPTSANGEMTREHAT